MKSNLLMNCLWYEDISLQCLANTLSLTQEALFKKIFQKEDFTQEEIEKICELLDLTDEEQNIIFG